MKTISNKTHEPIRIPLPGGKALHLGPLKSGQISDQAAQRPAIRKLVEEGRVEIAGEGSHAPSGADKGGGGHETTHGHAPSTLVRPKGNR